MVLNTSSIAYQASAAFPKKHRRAVDEATERISDDNIDFNSDAKSYLCAASPHFNEDPGTSLTDRQHLLMIITGLKDENERLCKALAESQHQVEGLRQERNNESTSGIDLAHILTIARELNMDFDNGADALQSAGSGEAEVFAIHSPRGEAPREQRSEGVYQDAAQLRQELEESRAEMAELQLHYAARDAALQTKFKALMAAVCGDACGSDMVQCQGEEESDEEVTESDEEITDV